MSTKKKPAAVQVKHFGHPGHFIAASRCVFHLCTLVGTKLVSTVGDYRPTDGEKSEIGWGRFYETMVFDTKVGSECKADGCDCGLPEIHPSELEMVPYNDAKSAAAGHFAMVEKVKGEIEAMRKAAS